MIELVNEYRTIFLLSLVVLLAVFFLRKQVIRFCKDVISFSGEIIRSRFLLFQLAKRDFQNRYLGTYFGLPWAFIQPAVSILVIWYVFTFGFRTGSSTSGSPYILWLITGMIPWFFISECVRNGSDVLLEYSYLLKKVNIRAAIIPLIKVITGLIIHLFFIVLTMVLVFYGGEREYLYWIQIVYYLPAGVFLCLGFIYLVSSINVFMRDVAQFVGVFMQLFFWVTPIFWELKMVPEKYQFYFSLNPFYYVINGYRETFIEHKWFFDNPIGMLKFWLFSIILFLVGVIVFKRLKPHFGDVL